MGVRLVSLRCPNCNANVDLVEGKRIVYCPHCGAGLAVDDDIQRAEKNINVKTEKNVNVKQTNFNVNEDRAEMLRQQKEIAKIKAHRAEVIGYLILMAFLFGMCFLMIILGH